MSSETRKKIKVLLLDDEYLARMSVIARLRNTEFEVTGVGTPEEAVAAIKKERFQAIITDVMMGDVDGFMFRDIVRGFNREVPMIFFSALVNDFANKFLYRVLEDSHSYYLPKGAPTSVMLNQLDKAVRAYRSERRARKLMATVESTNHLATFVQTSMLPPWARARSNFFYGVYWKPYDQVSGDLYEWIPVTRTSSLIVFGDISGHGVSAALAMTAVQSYLKRFLAVTDREARDVARIASQIHEFILENLSGVASMSGVVAYVNETECLLRYCNAGSPDIMAFSPDGVLTRLNPENRGGLSLGLMPGTTYSEDDVVTFHGPTDTLFAVCSDGVTDLSADADGQDRVPDELLERVIGECVKTIDDQRLIADASVPYRVMAMLRDFGYEHRLDDMTMLFFGIPRARENAILLDVPMDRSRIDAAARQAGEFLTSRPGYEDVAPRMELLIDEFFMNLYDHGFEDRARHKEFILFSLILGAESVELRVWHRAKPWTVSEQELSADASLDKANADFKSRGRGVAIIRKLTTSISHNHIAGLNVDSFFLPRVAETDSEGGARDGE